MDRRKELKEQYKNMKPDMGVFIIKSAIENKCYKCYIEAAQDLKSTINSTKFKLELGFHPNKELQKEWKENTGADSPRYSLTGTYRGFFVL